MAVTSDTPAPYTPTGQILEILTRYRDRGNPQLFNTESLGRIGVPDSLNARTLQALRVLDLINENGEPTDTFESIRLASSDQYKNILQEWLRATYADVFSIVDPANDDETKIRDAFRNYTPTGQQGRMVSLFLGLCEEAGLRQKTDKKEPASSVHKKSAVRASGPRRQRRTQSANQQSKIDSNLPTALIGLLNSLPDSTKGWTQDERDKFYKTIGAVLDFCYPIQADQQPNNDDQNEGEDVE